uniref:BHLH domain-containing protein n=1 Tax=Trichobilharzia regenti TaxID=157069 RepID=A0AA85IS78_TRIRE|nr:unnamed protein product [Trichobilharzia regenti]
MSSNCVKNLPPFQRISSIKRKRNQTINSLKGLRKHTRDRVHLKTSQNNRHLKPHQIECERLKEILPTVANCEKLDEVKIIQEAIKHINHLEQAVLQRLNIVNTQTTIENSKFYFDYLIHWNIDYLNISLLNTQILEDL